jgi:bifunctional non-homologous end joining protein LigD
MARSSASTGAPQTVTVEGHRLQLTNLDKVLYPSTGTTKGEVLHYLAQIAPVLIPHAANRPATRKRWPDGVEGQVFFQKNAESSTPSWVRTRRIQHKSSANDYVLVNDLATVTWLGQTATLEIHVPQWQFGRTGVHHHPDRLVLDLDPGPGAGLPECAQVAQWARAILVGMGLEPMPVTSGSKGIHLYAALDGKQDSEQVSAVARELARYLESEHPDLVVSDMKKSLRGGKVLVDWSQNNANKTTIAPYSLRGRDRGTSSTTPTCATSSTRRCSSASSRTATCSPSSPRATSRRSSPRPSAWRRSSASRSTAPSATRARPRNRSEPSRPTPCRPTPDRRSSSRSTTHAACTGTSGSSTTACS